MAEIDESKIKFTGFTFEDADKEVYVSLSDVRQAIAQTPAADVVEVVRCKDCKNLVVYDNCCMFFGHKADDNDFCSYGERK